MCLIVLFPSTRLSICLQNKWFHNYFCYFWSPSQALRPWKKERKKRNGAKTRMTEWGYGREVVGVKGLWKVVNASCPDACLPSVWTPTSRWHLFQSPPTPRIHARTHKHTHSRCRSHVHSNKLALLLTPAVLGSCGIGHGKQGYR